MGLFVLLIRFDITRGRKHVVQSSGQIFERFAKIGN
jgi:hypothetical protein